MVDQLIIMRLCRFHKVQGPIATWSYFLINAESGESARAAVVAAANKEVVAVLSGTTTIYYNTCFTRVQTMKSLNC